MKLRSAVLNDAIDFRAFEISIERKKLDPSENAKHWEWLAVYRVRLHFSDTVLFKFALPLHVTRENGGELWQVDENAFECAREHIQNKIRNLASIYPSADMTHNEWLALHPAI